MIRAASILGKQNMKSPVRGYKQEAYIYVLWIQLFTHFRFGKKKQQHFNSLMIIDRLNNNRRHTCANKRTSLAAALLRLVKLEPTQHHRKNHRFSIYSCHHFWVGLLHILTYKEYNIKC
ncbi:hypothetical protein ACJX0J_015211 [Zea mays]